MGDGMEGVKVSWMSQGTVVGVEVKTYFEEHIRVVADPGRGQPYLTLSLPKDLHTYIRLGDRVIISAHVMDSMGLNGLVDNGVYVEGPGVE